MSIEVGAKSFCWPKETVVRVLRDFVTLVESEKAMAAEAAAVAARYVRSEGYDYADLLDDLRSSWQLDNRLAHTRFLLSAPVGEDMDDWLEAEMADVVYWRQNRRPAPVRDAARLDEPPGCADPALACVGRATFLRLMRDLNMLVVSVHRVGREMASSRRRRPWRCSPSSAGSGACSRCWQGTRRSSPARWATRSSERATICRSGTLRTHSRRWPCSPPSAIGKSRASSSRRPGRVKTRMPGGGHAATGADRLSGLTAGDEESSGDLRRCRESIVTVGIPRAIHRDVGATS